MGKQSGKNKKQVVAQSGSCSVKQNNAGVNSPKAKDNDNWVFISMAQELKEEGNKLFQKRDIEGAMLKYEKAIKLLPQNHIDVSYLRSNIAACFMQIGPSEYPRAIHECNLALEVTPKYSKALLKRSRCYEALNRLDLALRDVTMVLKMEPNNLMALEISERVTKALEERGLAVNDSVIELPVEYIESPVPSPTVEVVKQKSKKKKGKKVEEKREVEEIGEIYATPAIQEKNRDDQFGERKAEDKVVVEEKIHEMKEDKPKRSVKLVFGEDIRWAQLPHDCNLLHLREVVSDRFLGLGEVLIKYRDEEGDLVTITTDEELRWAQASTESQGFLRLYIFEVNPDRNLFVEKLGEESRKHDMRKNSATENGHVNNYKERENGSYYIDDWIVEFAELFRSHVGFDADAYLGLHELGMKVYSEAMEETVTCEEAQKLLDIAAGKFQEMAALALFNWGNVHMSRARKRVYFIEDSSRESVLECIKTGYEWAQKEYENAGQRYSDAVKIKPDFYEGFLALAQQQFEQARLSWYYAISTNVDLETWPSTEVVQLYNSAEDNMDRGTEMWEEMEALRLSEHSKSTKAETKKDGSAEEAHEQSRIMRSQINLLWGTILYERSNMEFKLGLPVWQECLEVAVEKFQLAGASPTNIAVILKNHASNDSTPDGVGFKIDEIVQAWHEMYEARKLQGGFPSFRLEPLLKRRVSKLYNVLDLA